MKVALEKSFPVAAPAQAAWGVLHDIEAVASCMPGAKITERVDDTHYKGTVSVKVGPASLSFRGEIEVAAVDAAAKSIHLIAKGTDTTGSSAASMDLVANVVAAEGGTSQLVGKCETTMSGKAAAFGGRLMNSVADQILEQFAANFAARAAAASPPASGGGGVQLPASTQAGASSSTPAAPAAAQELNGLALAWGVFKSWLRGLFGKA